MNIPYPDCQNSSGACCGAGGQPGTATVPRCWKLNRKKIRIKS